MRVWGVALLLATGCAGDDGVEPPVETECEGAGDPVLELGDGGLSGFAPWTNGDSVVVEENGAGVWGFTVELLTHGIDTTQSTTAFLRFSIGDDPTTEDLGATLTFQCPNEGPGWFGFFAALDDAQQDAAVVATLDGLPMHLTGTVTDQAEDVGSAELDLVISVDL